MRKTSLRSLHKRAWAVFSLWVRRRDKGVCITCGRKGRIKEMHAGHFVHRDCMDFVESNIHCQCPQCNLWGHGKLNMYAQRLIELYGPTIVQELNTMGNKVHKFTRTELEDVIKKYSQGD